MPKIIVQDGDLVSVTLGGTVAAGDVYAGTDGIGVYMNSGVSGETVSVLISNVVTLPKAAPLVIGNLEAVFWDVGDTEINTTASGNVPAGICFGGAASAATTVQVKLNAGLALAAA